jgi:hypothetical protein
MGANPWRKEPSDAQLEARRKAGARTRARKSISVMDTAAVPASAGTVTPAGELVIENPVSDRRSAPAKEAAR